MAPKKKETWKLFNTFFLFENVGHLKRLTLACMAERLDTVNLTVSFQTKKKKEFVIFISSFF